MKQTLDPVISYVKYDLPLPSLQDNTGDWDRLARDLRKRGYEPLLPSPGRLKDLAYRIRELKFRGTALLKWNGFLWEVLEIRASENRNPLLGAAFDLGTTRIASYLVDLQHGSIIHQTSVENPQIPYGEDILSRIVYANTPEKLKHLQELLINRINDTIRNILKSANLNPDEAHRFIYAVAVAGNTTMSHFFAGLDPSGICKEPYIPVVNRFPPFRASEFGLRVHPDALLYLFPNVGSYFGGDVVAGIIATGMHRSEDISMLIDVGTNAEVVLGNKDWMIACAGAAGPALEGGVVERGMMAAPGAIDQVRINPDTLELSYHVIGDARPKGICGSGLIDLIAEMFQAGLLTIQGKINKKLKNKTHRIIETEDGTAFVVAHANETADGADLTITDIDIGILLKSKAAMYTILNMICRKVGIDIRDVKKIYVAGTFGNHIDPKMAIRIGMLPDLPLETFIPMGNTSGKGAVQFLLDRRVQREVEEICDKITYIELNVNVELMHEFRGALFIPHTDPRLFPSVRIPDAARG
ncbi:ASKHA domain-containing protein [Thermodesulforhabdus norvegica]|uniref:DUF4445 domain-containing protein n=1 Tax=Thermodesulforhabdus norvegica TaxID=39841 RepID=A0A1I4VXS6_9BACT|nr:ASKHA domain-containing protein [Thermodesulforhabdus norvegica]SFN06051.1 protein of unknown function [Thermodesulforhabdus norvegica]